MSESHPTAVPRRAAIFGGSFDPVHRGHLAMAERAREVAGIDRVLFMPAAVSPFKKGTVASGPQRWTMLGIAVAESGLDWAEVSDFELNRPAPSYSWETANHFSKAFPGTEWFWILGTDQWEQIDRWAEPEILRHLLHFLVFTREGEPVRDRPDWRHTAISFSHPASSTAIRADLPKHRDWLCPGVLRYCREEGLYA
jgi:nicotinate-nucleotide adenylyltransferase